MHLAPLICVRSVSACSLWYQELLGLTSGHGGEEYERLNAGNRLLLQLHKWEAEHHHGPLGDALIKPYGNGVILWFELEDFHAAVLRAQTMKVEVLRPSQISQNGNWEYWLRDLEGYTVVLTSPLP
jgi:extradiol dioxygenase family protein